MTAVSTAITHQIVLDTETTGMNQVGAHYEGHKVAEIDAVEVVDRRLTGNNFHAYLKPDRLVDPEAFGVHDIADESLLDRPTLTEVADGFMDYIRDVKLVIHNAAFNIGFMDYEFLLLKRGIPKTNAFCRVTDSLAVARKMFPGKRNSFDALCACYKIDSSKRTLHEALLDAQILVEVYLAMTDGQMSMVFAMEGEAQQQQGETTIQRIARRANKLHAVFVTDEGLAAREARLDLVQKRGGGYLWRAQIPVKDAKNSDLGDFYSKRFKR